MYFPSRFSFCMDGEKDPLSSRRRFIQSFLNGITVSSVYDVAQLSKIMDGYGIVNSISNVPTQYLCNAAYYHMLCINKNAVFIHVPSIKGMNDALMDRLLTLFRKIPFDT